MHGIIACALAALVAVAPKPAAAWGDEGHKVIAIIASQLLDPSVRTKVEAILATDTDPLTLHDIASEANWADKYRDSDRNGAKVRYLGTRQWHFVDIEISRPDLDAACFGHPPLPSGTAASAGPAQACAVDKIEQFSAELHNPNTTPAERLLALKFLLHLVGDLHQPLHASDDHDAGANQKQISSGGLGARNLHGLWDTELVAQLGSSPQQIASTLAGHITPDQRQEWSQGQASDWAIEASAIARAHAYGRLPPSSADGFYALPTSYIQTAMPDVETQLGRAGVRLAAVLNRALGQ